MKIINKKLGDIHPYENNPRNNDNAVSYVASSIKRFGFRVPIIIDTKGVIVCGHTRYEAAKQLGMDKVPCLMAEDMTEEQIKKFRLVDNKVAELSTWEWDKLQKELSEITQIDMPDEFGFEKVEVEEPKEKAKKEKATGMCKCPRCGKQFEVSHED